MGQTTAADTRCPRCSALVRPGAPWCTQCYAPAGDRPPAAAPEVVVAAAPEPGPAPDPDPALPAAPARPAGTWPCTACAHPNDLALASCAACGTPFLAAARDAPPTLVLPVVGDLLALAPLRRVALAVGVVVAFVLSTALLALLVA